MASNINGYKTSARQNRPMNRNERSRSNNDRSRSTNDKSGATGATPSKNEHATEQQTASQLKQQTAPQVKQLGVTAALSLRAPEASEEALTKDLLACLQPLGVVQSTDQKMERIIILASLGEIIGK